MPLQVASVRGIKHFPTPRFKRLGLSREEINFPAEHPQDGAHIPITLHGQFTRRW